MPFRTRSLAVTLSLAATLASGVGALVACDSSSVDAGAETDAAPPPDEPAFPPPVAEPGRHDVQVMETRRIVPSAGLPSSAPVLVANNNLDVIRFGGRAWLAWRTAPDHYASDRTLVVVVSSADEIT